MKTGMMDAECNSYACSFKKIKKIKKVVDIYIAYQYNNNCVREKQIKPETGVWLSLVERLVWDQEVAGSNPVTPM